MHLVSYCSRTGITGCCRNRFGQYSCLTDLICMYVMCMLNSYMPYLICMHLNKCMLNSGRSVLFYMHVFNMQASQLAHVSQSKRRCKVPAHLHPSTISVAKKQQSVLSRFVTTPKKQSAKRKRKSRMRLASSESNTNSSSDADESGTKKMRRADMEEAANEMFDELVRSYPYKINIFPILQIQTHVHYTCRQRWIRMQLRI